MFSHPSVGFSGFLRRYQHIAPSAITDQGDIVLLKQYLLDDRDIFGWTALSTYQSFCAVVNANGDGIAAPDHWGGSWKFKCWSTGAQDAPPNALTRRNRRRLVSALLSARRSKGLRTSCSKVRLTVAPGYPCRVRARLRIRDCCLRCRQPRLAGGCAAVGYAAASDFWCPYCNSRNLLCTRLARSYRAAASSASLAAPSDASSNMVISSSVIAISTEIPDSRSMSATLIIPSCACFSAAEILLPRARSSSPPSPYSFMMSYASCQKNQSAFIPLSVFNPFFIRVSFVAASRRGLPLLPRSLFTSLLRTPCRRLPASLRLPYCRRQGETESLPQGVWRGQRTTCRPERRDST